MCMHTWLVEVLPHWLTTVPQALCCSRGAAKNRENPFRSFFPPSRFLNI